MICLSLLRSAAIASYGFWIARASILGDVVRKPCFGVQTLKFRNLCLTEDYHPLGPLANDRLEPSQNLWDVGAVKMLLPVQLKGW